MCGVLGRGVEQMRSSLPCGAHKPAENTDRDKPVGRCFIYLLFGNW